MDLFSTEENNNPQIITLQDADISYYPSLFNEDEASQLYEILINEIDWQQDDIKIFGKVYPQPRLTALYANNTKSYTYSGIQMFPKKFTPTLESIREKIEAICKVTFTSVLLNLYRDGNDSNGWHSDDEKELGINPVIASVSFGAKRCFQLKHKRDKKLNYKLFLNHGSLLLMKGATQHHWKHQLAKTKISVSPRINLTFRIIQ